jgi:hypothetical protein
MIAILLSGYGQCKNFLVSLLVFKVNAEQFELKNAL